MMRQPQQGLSLIELMIALVLGLLILAGVVQVFLGGRATQNLQQRLGDLQENGRFAILFLQRDIRMAGFPKNAVPAVDAFNKTAQPSTTCPSPLTTAALTCDGGGTVSDEITVSYQGTSDCAGQAVAGGTVTNTFFVDTRRLMCRGNGNAQAQPLVDGVENLQILYGEDMTADGYADRYVRADDVGNWNNVVAVRVAVLASSVDTVMGENTNSGTFQVLDVAGVGPLPAGVRGRVFTSTIELRNRTQ
ncbi:MAG: prepilin-type N-terminal cleavage/methylation domain-containing protein [Nevskiaceae bacterium]|nr:MAG: prepilin-type N-terminal cleavage/methylation domain-containing protein [Nevskiaceae bacterium]